MPRSSEWIPNEVYLRFDGVTVHFVYRDDDLEQGARSYWYSLSPEGSDIGDEDEGTFDVRDLPTWGEAVEDTAGAAVGGSTEEDAAIRTAITLAIQQGILTKDGRIDRSGG